MVTDGGDCDDDKLSPMAFSCNRSTHSWQEQKCPHNNAVILSGREKLIDTRLHPLIARGRGGGNGRGRRRANQQVASAQAIKCHKCGGENHLARHCLSKN